MEAVKRIRQEQGLSQQALANLADVNKVTLIRIESGKGNPNIETLEKLANALGVEIAEFFPKAQASLFQPEEEEQRRTQEAKPPQTIVPVEPLTLRAEMLEIEVRLQRVLTLIESGKTEEAAAELREILDRAA